MEKDVKTPVNLQRETQNYSLIIGSVAVWHGDSSNAGKGKSSSQKILIPLQLRNYAARRKVY